MLCSHAEPSRVKGYADAPHLHLLPYGTQVSPWAALLRLMPVVPLARWRSLSEYLLALDRQKAAFAKAHGPFLYLLALGAASGAGDGAWCEGGALLQHVAEAAEAARQVLYVEARAAQRGWLRQRGFADVMKYQPRGRAPLIYIMARVPAARAPSPPRRRR